MKPSNSPAFCLYFHPMLIFLDLDGVMIPARSWTVPEILDDGFPAFSEKAGNVLKQLIKDGAKIILTSSHKTRFSLSEWKAIFNQRGIQVSEFDVLPENYNHQDRHDEIVNWFLANTVHECFVIIDDDSSLHNLPAGLKEHLVLTFPMIGLTEQHLTQIYSILFRNSGPTP